MPFAWCCDCGCSMHLTMVDKDPKKPLPEKVYCYTCWKKEVARLDAEKEVKKDAENGNTKETT